MPNVSVELDVRYAEGGDIHRTADSACRPFRTIALVVAHVLDDGEEKVETLLHDMLCEQSHRTGALSYGQCVLYQLHLKLAPPRDLEIARAAVYKEVPPKAS